jgi:hypothetical protein
LWQEHGVNGGVEPSSPIDNVCDFCHGDERRPFANHALPDRAECYEPVVRFLAAQQA